MRIIGSIILILSFCRTDISVPQVRDAYFKCAASKKEAMYFVQMLDTLNEDTTPVILCYKGAAEMFKAKQAVNPIRKFACFNRGKTLIEEAIAKDTSNIESRFIRYSIQQHLPSFLKYNNSMHRDSILITQEICKLKDIDLKNRITAYFNRLKAEGRKNN